jgi:hypothetical protein
MLSFDIGVAIKQSGTKLDPVLLEAFIAVESGGKGFDTKTGKLIIQFEPIPFFNRTQMLIDNKVDVQSKEWDAFNRAFAQNRNAAMESTSIGLPQIMGFHWKRLGYSSVGAMWDEFKAGLVNQICALIKFIETDKLLLKAFNEKDWHKMAYFYNGAGYAEQAHRLGIKPYNEQLKAAYESLTKQA